MKKIIRKVGDSLGIIFNKEERNIYKLEKGKVLEVSFREVEPDAN